MIPKHTIRNLAIAVIVPTVMFTIALLGVQYIKTPKPVVGKFRDSTNINLQGMLDANISLKPYLKFDSIQNVCDSATTKFLIQNGRVYSVRLDSIFPKTILKGLQAYTTYTYIDKSDFYCDGGHVGDNLLLVKNGFTGEYHLIFPQEKTSILLGNASFDLRNDLWHTLACYGILTKATIALLVSLAIIFISLLIYHPKSNANFWSFLIAALLGAIWLYGYNVSCGQDKFYDFPNIFRLYITLCWLGSIIALFIPLERRNEFFVEKQKEEKMQRKEESKQVIEKHRIEEEKQIENEKMENQLLNGVAPNSK